VIITDKNKLNEICEPCSSVEEGEEIAAKLLEELVKSMTGIGLAANQIGINKRVCVINVREEPLILINPEIIEKSNDMYAFKEGCLSFPNKYITTVRHKQIKVKADNHKEPIELKVIEDSDKNAYLTSAYEVACVQHEIDHLYGITMFDRKFVRPQIISNKIGRNQKVKIKKNDEILELKYKKINKYLEDGWTLLEQ
tara:strand:- start:182 stop:772 length:591 start_codon:yes stop_codon:yes gene_type:complete